MRARGKEFQTSISPNQQSSQSSIHLSKIRANPTMVCSIVYIKRGSNRVSHCCIVELETVVNGVPIHSSIPLLHFTHFPRIPFPHTLGPRYDMDLSSDEEDSDEEEDYEEGCEKKLPFIGTPEQISQSRTSAKNRIKVDTIVKSLPRTTKKKRLNWKVRMGKRILPITQAEVDELTQWSKFCPTTGKFTLVNPKAKSPEDKKLTRSETIVSETTHEVISMTNRVKEIFGTRTGNHHTTIPSRYHHQQQHHSIHHRYQQ